MEAGFVVTLGLVASFTLVIGIIIGMLIARAPKNSDKSKGVIYAYYGEPDGVPSLLLEQHVSISEIASSDRVTFDVVVVK